MGKTLNENKGIVLEQSATPSACPNKIEKSEVTQLAQEAGNATFGLRTAFARTFDQQERADTILNSVKQIKDKNVLDPTNDECYPAKELFEKRWKIANKGKYKITSTILHPFSDDDKLSFTQTLNMLINSDYYKGSSYSETQDVIDTLKQSLKIYNENAPTPPTPNPPTPNPPTPNPPKTDDTTSKDPNDKTSYPACVQVFGEPTASAKGYVSIWGTGSWNDYLFYNNGKVGKPDGNMDDYSCDGNTIKIGKSSSRGKTGGGSPSVKIPAELGDKTGVMNFQNWLDENKPGWASGYQGGVVSKGRGYGNFGPRTQKAWASYGKEFLSGGKKQEPEVGQTPGEESINDVNNS
jgi:hypothetical protein